MSASGVSERLSVRPSASVLAQHIDPFAALLALVLSAVVGITSISHPLFAALPVAAFLGALLLVDGRARVALVVFGGLFLLQRSGGLNSLKLALLGGFVAAFTGAVFNVRRMRQTAPYQLVAPLFSVSVAFAALVALSLVAAHLRGTPLADSVRDATPYLLFASVPVFALDAQSVLNRRSLVRVLVVAGVLGAISFAIVWLQRRGLANLPLSRIGAASLFVPAALFSFAISISLQANARRSRWLVLAAILVALLIPTGTRTTLALFVAPIAIVIASRRELVTRSFRLALLAPMAVSLILVFGLAVVALTHANTDFLQKRVSLLSSSGNSQADASYNDRIKEGRAAWSAFKSSPFFGVGPGYAFEYLPQGAQQPFSSFQLDTPLTFPAKFGVIGLLLLSFTVMKFWHFLRKMARLAPGISYLALAGYLAVVVALSVFAPPLEDKGFSYGLIVALALALDSVCDPPRERRVVGASRR